MVTVPDLSHRHLASFQRGLKQRSAPRLVGRGTTDRTRERRRLRSISCDTSPIGQQRPAVKLLLAEDTASGMSSSGREKIPHRKRWHVFRLGCSDVIHVEPLHPRLCPARPLRDGRSLEMETRLPRERIIDLDVGKEAGSRPEVPGGR